MKKDLIERLTTYVKVDTQSEDGVEATPSTPGQLVLGNMLVKELIEIGMEEVSIDEYGYVMATLPANIDKHVPTIGFIAHLDTSSDFTGKNVNPQIVEKYDGGDIVLNEALQVVLSVNDFPQLSNYKGHTLITTDGSTLLGADDKAGIAEIMTAMAYLIEHPEIKHGKIKVAFTPDEETSKGPVKFNIDAFNAPFAYTIDGGPLGELEFESFNAAEATITIKGRNIHPGTAKGKMVNSSKIAMELNRRLPVEEAPEFTDGYEGFYHLTNINGTVEQTTLNYLIRDFDKENFNNRKVMIEKIVHDLQTIYGKDIIHLEINDQYYNMKEKIEPVFEIVEIAAQAMKNLGISPDIKPIRGGTDGSTLSYMGLPTPNIFTGGENYHSKYEFVSVDNMVKATNVIIEVVRIFGEKTE
ncbi:tripeptide aminopeptidase [Cytobacillus eiseniae]|uniref:Peptidase T n=1 Tax=Cytobacillus eiseniae TaxID=762947 RepID=A0ABS4RFD2_9BACI|nr:peptidase T [Cytobacillus eiseniae]MBP2241610.1 tripeptide aminopeptidase [Cytobacillus eiseniae]